MFHLLPGSGLLTASLCGPEWHGNYDKLFFRWQSSPDLLVSPYLNSNKTNMLKQGYVS